MRGADRADSAAEADLEAQHPVVRQDECRQGRDEEGVWQVCGSSLVKGSEVVCQT